MIPQEAINLSAITEPDARYAEGTINSAVVYHYDGGTGELIMVSSGVANARIFRGKGFLGWEHGY